MGRFNDGDTIKVTVGKIGKFEFHKALTENKAV